MLATALAPVIGYDEAAKLAKEAFKSGRTIRELALERGMDAGRARPAARPGRDDRARPRRRTRPAADVPGGRHETGRRRRGPRRPLDPRAGIPTAVQAGPKTSQPAGHGTSIATAAAATRPRRPIVSPGHDRRPRRRASCRRSPRSVRPPVTGPSAQPSAVADQRDDPREVARRPRARRRAPGDPRAAIARAKARSRRPRRPGRRPRPATAGTTSMR